MRACRSLETREIPGAPRRFVVDTTLGPEVLQRLTDPVVRRQPLRDGTFLWVDVATTPGAAVLLGTDVGGADARGGAMATYVDPLALGSDPSTGGVVRLHSDAEVWLPCCGAAIDGVLAFNARRCSVAFEHLPDAYELLPIPPVAATYRTAPLAGPQVLVGGEPRAWLHCQGVVLSGAEVWSLWADARGQPRSWEPHSGVDDLAADLHTPRQVRAGGEGHLHPDGHDVALAFPYAEPLEELCQRFAFGVRVLGR